MLKTQRRTKVKLSLEARAGASACHSHMAVATTDGVVMGTMVDNFVITGKLTQI
jgi:hypothetical protein